MIILGAADSKGIAPAVKRAKEAGIVVIAVDVGADGGVDATVMSDNKQAGQQAGQYIVDKLKGKGADGDRERSSDHLSARPCGGCARSAKKHPDIKILSQDQNAGGSRDGGLRIMTDLLTANPTLDAVFAINDPTGIGCDLAAKQAQRNEFFIVGVDGSPDGATTLKSKGSLFAGHSGSRSVHDGEKSGRSWLWGHERQEARTGNDLDSDQADHPRECERVSRLDKVAKPTS
jgi:ribose transport system substrate-binding protein